MGVSPRLKLCELRESPERTTLNQGLYFLGCLQIGDSIPNFTPKNCQRCEDSFDPASSAQLYCSTKCKGRNAYYVRVYGITQQDYENRKSAQGNLCALCRLPGFILNAERHHEKLCVDHCHKTGVLRELLCHNCNRALGLFQDDPILIRKAADYIEKYKQGATTRA